jgi:acetolactate synthase-1/2/3 large subunit
VWDAAARSDIELLHFRHEAGAAFAAAEAYFATGRPTAVCVTSGPGVTNALTGLFAARGDGAKTILISGATSANKRGKGAFQETGPQTLGPDLFRTGPLFHYAAQIHTPDDLTDAADHLALGLDRPGAFIAHLSLSTAAQTTPAPRIAPPKPGARTAPRARAQTIDDCAEIIAHERIAIWLGFGARQASQQVAALAEAVRAPVFCSPRAKGIFPEDHPLFIGISGLGSDSAVTDFMRRVAPDRVLVLGSRLGEMTSFWHPDLVPSRGFIHVDIDPRVPGAAYPHAPTVAVEADIGTFLDDVLQALPARLPDPAEQDHARNPTAPQALPDSTGPVRPQILMSELQRIAVQDSDALILAEAGNAYAWGTLGLRFTAPGRYRVSTGFGAMGHAAAGVVGVAHATGRKAVALLGDGAMLMNCEISTAAQYKIPAVWVVLNDSGYGMIRQGMSLEGYTPAQVDLPPTDFAAIARAMGAHGIRAETEDTLPLALKTAMNTPGPCVVDVRIDPTCAAPFGNRVASLMSQKTHTRESP